jgi:lactate permease
LVVIFLLIRPVHQSLGSIKLGFLLPETVDSTVTTLFAPISVFTHSGTILLATSILLYVYYLRKKYVLRENMGRTIVAAMNKAGQAILPVLCLIMMSKVMDGTGQIAILAEGTAIALNGVYPIVAPMIGILGAFLCSSNMSSNILFAGFQNNIAHTLQVDSTVILAAQTAGGSIGNLLSTSNIVLGLVVTKATDKAGKVLIFLFPVCIGVGILCGLFTLLLS